MHICTAMFGFCSTSKTAPRTLQSCQESACRAVMKRFSEPVGCRGAAAARAGIVAGWQEGEALRKFWLH